MSPPPRLPYQEPRTPPCSRPAAPALPPQPQASAPFGSRLATPAHPVRARFQRPPATPTQSLPFLCPTSTSLRPVRKIRKLQDSRIRTSSQFSGSKKGPVWDPPASLVLQNRQSIICNHFVVLIDNPSGHIFVSPARISSL